MTTIRHTCLGTYGYHRIRARVRCYMDLPWHVWQTARKCPPELTEK